MIEIGNGKQSLQLSTPVIGASGCFGYANEYGRLIRLDKLGALVTNPVSLKPRRVSHGTRVVALDSGVMLHTGLPNPGLYKVIQQYAIKWKNLPTKVILHLIVSTVEGLTQCLHIAEQHDAIAAIELGLSDDSTYREVRQLVATARQHTQLPLLASLPLLLAPQLAAAAEEAGADALVVAAPPRGTERDPLTGQFVGGRLFGPWLKAFGLRAVGSIAPRVKIPVIGAGGIFTPLDARDYVAAGAKAVQLDAVAWVKPSMVEIIARDLGGLELTRVGGSLADEWWPGIGETAAMRAQILPSPRPIPQPKDLPK